MSRRRGGGSGGVRRILGRRGERVAARHLRRGGYRILARNLEIGRDEADLLALDPRGDTLVIVEVKTRAGSAVAPEASIGPAKQRRLIRLGTALRARERYADLALRFDAVSIVWPEGGRPQVTHFVGAFESPW